MWGGGWSQLHKRTTLLCSSVRVVKKARYVVTFTSLPICFYVFWLELGRVCIYLEEFYDINKHRELNTYDLETIL